MWIELLLACHQAIEMGVPPKDEQADTALTGSGDSTPTDSTLTDSAPTDSGPPDTSTDSSTDTSTDSSGDSTADTTDTGDPPLVDGGWVMSANGNPTLTDGWIRDVYLFDLDGDGVDEMVFTDTDLTDDFEPSDDAWWISVSCWLGYERWSAPTWYPLDHPEDLLLAIDAADLDGDGLSEIVVGHAEGYSIFPGRTCGYLGERRDVDGPPFQALMLEDLDADGATDLLGYVPASGETDFLRGDGAGSFELAASATDLNSRRSATGVRADLDEDGRPELVIRETDDMTARTVWFSVAWVDDGAVRVDNSFLEPLGQQDLWSFAPVRTAAGTLLAYNQYDSAGVPLVGWTGTGWSAGGELADAESTLVAAGDHDGDGWDDVYVMDWDQTLSIYLHADGYRTPLTRRVGAVTQAWWNGLAVGDVNGDGRPDAVLTGSEYPEIVLGR